MRMPCPADDLRNANVPPSMENPFPAWIREIGLYYIVHALIRQLVTKRTIHLCIVLVFLNEQNTLPERYFFRDGEGTTYN